MIFITLEELEMKFKSLNWINDLILLVSVIGFSYVYGTLLYNGFLGKTLKSLATASHLYSVNWLFAITISTMLPMLLSLIATMYILGRLEDNWKYTDDEIAVYSIIAIVSIYLLSFIYYL